MTTTTTQNPHDAEYLKLLEDVLENGEYQTTRAVLKSTGRPVGAYTVFGRQSRYDLRKGFPLLTTKQVSFKAIAVELLWFLSGSTNIKFLKDNGVSIWDSWADKDGNLGPVYGQQWRKWGDAKLVEKGNHYRVGKEGSQGFSGFVSPPMEHDTWVPQEPIDQISNVIEQIKTNPASRRLVVSAWNPAIIDQCKLPPCHFTFTFNVNQRTSELDCMFTMRSSDVFLGNPYNIASYALLTHMIAQVTGLKPGVLVYTGQNVHVYENHIEQAREQLNRGSSTFSPPALVLDPTIKNIDDFKLEHLKLQDYQSHPAIKGEVAV